MVVGSPTVLIEAIDLAWFPGFLELVSALALNGSPIYVRKVAKKQTEACE